VGLPSTRSFILVVEQGTHDLCSLIFSKKGQNDNKQQSKAVPLQSGMTLALSFVVILAFVAINQVVNKVTSSLLHIRNKICRRWQGFRRHYDLITITQNSWPEYNPNHLVRKAEISAIQLEKKQKTCMACEMHLCNCIFGSTSISTSFTGCHAAGDFMPSERLQNSSQTHLPPVNCLLYAGTYQVSAQCKVRMFC